MKTFTTNKNVLDVMDDFLNPIKMEKKAFDTAEQIKSESGKAQTTEVNKGDGRSGGVFGSEKRGDLAEAMRNVTGATTDAATVKAGDGKSFADNVGTNSMDADQKLSQPSVNVNTTSDPADDNKKNNKGQTGGHHNMSTEKQAFARNSYLADKILGKLQNMNDYSNIQKTASFQKTAAEQIATAEANEFYEGYRRGLEKKAEDMESLVEAGVPAEAAEAALDETAVEDPAAVMPEEAMGGEEDEVMAELAQAMEEQGVTEEDLAEAQAVVADLEESGIPPEEIMEAVMATGEGSLDKVSSERVQVVGSYLQDLYAGR